MSESNGDRYGIPYSPFKIASNRIMMARNCTVQMKTIFSRMSKIYRKVLVGDIVTEIKALEREAAELETLSAELSKAIAEMKKVKL